MPIGACYAGTLWLGNAAYLYLSVSFIQMLKVCTQASATAATLHVFLDVLNKQHHILLYIDKKFLQALMPVAVFAVGCIFKTEKYNGGTLVNMLIVSLGVAIASYGKSAPGLLLRSASQQGCCLFPFLTRWSAVLQGSSILSQLGSYCRCAQLQLNLRVWCWCKYCCRDEA